MAHFPRPGEVSVQRPAISTGGATGGGGAAARGGCSGSGLASRIVPHPVAINATAARHESGRSKVLVAAIQLTSSWE